MAAPVGNQNARNAKRFQQAMRRALARECGSVDDGLEQAAAKLVRAALAGEAWAIKEVRDTEDGKPAQTIAGDPDAPLHTHSVTEIVNRGVVPQNADRG